MSDKKCEWCEEHEAVFSIEVICTDDSVHESDLICPSCVANWFNETAEDVERMSVVRLKEIENGKMVVA